MRFEVLKSDADACADFCARYTAKKGMPVSSGSAWSDSDGNQFAGKLVEIVVGRVLRIPVDLRVYTGRDAGADMTLPDSRSLGARGVAVAANMDHDFNLIYRPHEAVVDVLLLGLVTPKRDAVVMAGYLPFAEFKALAKPKKWDGRVCHFSKVDNPTVVPRSRLRPWSELVFWFDL